MEINISGVDYNGKTYFIGLICFDLGKFVGVRKQNLTAEADKCADKSPKPWSKNGIFENVLLSFDLSIIEGNTSEANSVDE